jgi:hypothetical protein
MTGQPAPSLGAQRAAKLDASKNLACAVLI